MIGLDSYAKQDFNYLDPSLIYISLWIDCLFEIRKIVACFLRVSFPAHYRVTDEALLAETTWYDPPPFLWMFSLLLKDLISDFYFPVELLRHILKRDGREVPQTKFDYQWHEEEEKHTRHTL